MERSAGRVIKMKGTGELAGMRIHCSPFGVIPKKNKPGNWRLIVDLSSPEGSSVNDGITKELATLTYVSVDTVVGRVLELGKGSLFAKMDIRQAYRNIPVHPEDRILLGMAWEGSVYVDAALPFGLRSAPLIFSAVSDTLQWIVKKGGVTWAKHYIDDFITVGRPGAAECADNMAIMLQMCERVGLLVAHEKSEGPATRLTFLGMELDTQSLEIRLPAKKLRQLKDLLACWRGRKACRKRELLSLVGVLAHADKAVRAGRSFTRRLIDLAASVKKLDQFVCLNLEARADVAWW